MDDMESLETSSLDSGWTSFQARKASSKPPDHGTDEGDRMGRLRAGQGHMPSQQTSRTRNKDTTEGDLMARRPDESPKGGNLMARLQAAQVSLTAQMRSAKGHGPSARAGTACQSSPKQKVRATTLAEHLAAMDQDLRGSDPSSESSKSEERDRALLGQAVAEEIANRSCSSGSVGSSSRRERLLNRSHGPQMLPNSSSLATSVPLPWRRGNGNGSSGSQRKGQAQQAMEDMKDEGCTQDNAALLMEIMALKEQLKWANCDNHTLRQELRVIPQKESMHKKDEKWYNWKIETLEAFSEENTERNNALQAAMATMMKQKNEDDDAGVDLKAKFAGMEARHAEQLAILRAENGAERAVDKLTVKRDQDDAAEALLLQEDESKALYTQNAELRAQGMIDRGKLAALMAWSETVQADHKAQVTGLEELLRTANKGLAAEDAKDHGHVGRRSAAVDPLPKHALEMNLRRQLADMQEKLRKALDELLEARMQAAGKPEAPKPKAGRATAPPGPAPQARLPRTAGHGFGPSRSRIVGGVNLGKRPPCTAPLSSIQEDDEVSSCSGGASSRAPGADDVGNLEDLEEEEAEARGPEDAGPLRAQVLELQVQIARITEEMQQKLYEKQKHQDELREEAADSKARANAKIGQLMEFLRWAREGKRENWNEINRLNRIALDVASRHASDQNEMRWALKEARAEHVESEEKLHSKAVQQDIEYTTLQEDLNFALEGWRLADGRLEDFKVAMEAASKEKALQMAAAEQRRGTQALSADRAADPLEAKVSSLQQQLEQAIENYNLLQNSIELREATWETEREEMQRQHAMALEDQMQNHQKETSKLMATVEKLRQDRNALQAERDKLQSEKDEIWGHASLLPGAIPPPCAKQKLQPALPMEQALQEDSC